MSSQTWQEKQKKNCINWTSSELKLLIHELSCKKDEDKLQTERKHLQTTYPAKDFFLENTNNS